MASKQQSNPQIALELIEERIYFIRGQKVMLDSDLAALYGVTTKRLNEQVKRNFSRFPNDFMLRLVPEDIEQLNRSQIATGSQKHRDPKFQPYAFTEHGAVMLASVLNSPVAIQASIKVVRAFVQLRSILATHKDLAKRVEKLEAETSTNFDAIVELIKKYIAPPEVPRPKIGYRIDDKLQGRTLRP